MLRVEGQIWGMLVRELRENEWDEVAGLIFRSTNDWYERNLNRGCFGGDDSSVCRIFPEVYEALDPGCCLVAEVEGKIAGSCFYHPRETHVSLGIMNVSSGAGGRGVAGMLLGEVVKRADGKPVRLVSSAMNLDSYSLYTRAGFRPAAVYQDMYFPKGRGLPSANGQVRRAQSGDVDALVTLEDGLCGIRRRKDFEFFIRNESGLWNGFVFERDGEIEGFLFSVNHPGSRMLGPGGMKSTELALELIAAGLEEFGEEAPIFLVPARESELVSALYAAGARNCELHLSQVLGDAREAKGILMPTFMPETG